MRRSRSSGGEFLRRGAAGNGGGRRSGGGWGGGGGPVLAGGGGCRVALPAVSASEALSALVRRRLSSRHLSLSTYSSRVSLGG